MSSYDIPADDGIITPQQFKESMKLVRLQIAIPISGMSIVRALSDDYPRGQADQITVLMSMGTSIICALALKPGLRGINDLYPTLLTPNVPMVGFYWGLIFILEVGFCLNLLLARRDVTKVSIALSIGGTCEFTDIHNKTVIDS
jgi:hypothetical protein